MKEIIIYVCNFGKKDVHVSSQECKKKNHETTHILRCHPRRWEYALKRAPSCIKPPDLYFDVLTRDIPLYVEIPEEAVERVGDISE